MKLNNTTPTPNTLFDTHLPQLTESELKILLIIIRQTNGWLIKNSKKRKVRDRITHNQFQTKTGLCRRVVSKAIQSLVEKKLIHVTDYDGNMLRLPKHRTGKSYLFYQPAHELSSTGAQKLPEPVHRSAYNKRKERKRTKGRGRSVGHVEPQHISSLFSLGRF